MWSTAYHELLYLRRAITRDYLLYYVLLLFGYVAQYTPWLRTHRVIYSRRAGSSFLEGLTESGQKCFVYTPFDGGENKCCSLKAFFFCISTNFTMGQRDICSFKASFLQFYTCCCGAERNLYNRIADFMQFY